MAFPQMGSFSFYHSNQPDDLYLNMTSTQIKAAFDSRSNEVHDFLNSFIASVNLDGAKNIGTLPITGVTGGTVQLMLQDLKAQINTGNTTAAALDTRLTTVENNKYDKTGGTISGNISVTGTGTVTGNLTTSGTLSSATRLNFTSLTTGNTQGIFTSTTTIFLGNISTILQLEASANPNVKIGANTYALSSSFNTYTKTEVDNLLTPKYDKTGGQITGQVTIQNVSNNLIIKGTATGSGSNEYIAFHDSAGTRQGYIGKGSPSDNTFSVVGESGDLILTSNIGNINLNATQIRASGAIYESGTALSGRYLSLTGGTVTGGLIVQNTITIDTNNSAQFIVKSTTNDSYIRFTANATDNYIQSGFNDGSTPKNLRLTGVLGSTIPTLTIQATATNLSGTLNATSLSEGGTTLASKYLALSGGTLTNNLTLSAGNVTIAANAKFIASSLQMRSNGVDSVISSNGTGSLYLRPNGDAVTTGQVKIDTAGNLDATTLSEGGVSLVTKYPLRSEIPAGSTVIDNLTSTSTTASLSANMGRQLDVTKLNLSGGTLTGALTGTSATFSGLISTAASMSLTGSNVGIDIGNKAAANTPFVDFNSSGFSNDYDVRLLASGGTNGTIGQGVLTITAGNVRFSNTIDALAGGYKSTLGSAAFTHFTFLKSTFKSWTMQHSASGDLIWYPSTAADGTTWDVTSAFSFKTDGTFGAKVLQENGVNLTSRYLLLSGGTMTGHLVFDTTAEKNIKGSGASNWGMFINNVGVGLYDWSNSRAILQYTASTNTTVSQGTLNATVLQENGVSLSSKYVPIAGGTMTGNLNMDIGDKLTFGLSGGLSYNTITEILSNDSIRIKSGDSSSYRALTIERNQNKAAYSIDSIGSANLELLDSTNAIKSKVTLNQDGSIQTSGPINEGGTLLSAKYLSLTGGTISNTFTIDKTTTGPNLFVKNSVDNGTMRFVTTGAGNYIQSGDYPFTASKDLLITGINATNMTNLKLNANNVIVNGVLTSTVTYNLFPSGMQNGWTANGTGTELRYAILPGNVCHITGIITGGTRAAGTLLATLPVGVVPLRTCWEMCMVRMTGDVKMSSIDVNTDRTIAVGGIGWTQTGQTWVSINIMIPLA